VNPRGAVAKKILVRAPFRGRGIRVDQYLLDSAEAAPGNQGKDFNLVEIEIRSHNA
jgi:hypothetical protein